MKKITRILKTLIIINTFILISTTFAMAQLKPAFNVTINGVVYDLEFSPDGLYVAVGGMMPVNLINLTTQETIQIDQIGEHGLGYIHDLNFSRDGTKLVATRADRRLISYFDITEKKLIQEFYVEDLPQDLHISSASGDISPDQSMVALGIVDYIYLWSTIDGELLDKISLDSLVDKIYFVNQNQIYIHASKSGLIDLRTNIFEERPTAILVKNNYTLSQAADNGNIYKSNNILTNAFVKEYIIPGDNVMDIILNNANLVITKQNFEFELKKLTADNNPQTLAKFELELDPEYARSKFSLDGKMVAIYAGDTMSFYDISDLTSSVDILPELDN